MATKFHVAKSNWLFGTEFQGATEKITSASSLSLTDPWQCPTWPWHGRLAPKWLTFFVFSGLTSWLAESCLYCKCASKWPVCVSPSGGDHHAPTLLTTGNKGPIEWSWQSRQRGSLMANLHAFVQGNWSQLQGNRWNSLRYPHSGFPLTFFFGFFITIFFPSPPEIPWRVLRVNTQKHGKFCFVLTVSGRKF